MKTYIGIDNGVSGSIALIEDGRVLFVPVPVKTEQNYTRAKAKITRIDWMSLEIMLASWVSYREEERESLRVFLERPYVNPKGFKATVSALRALESTLITLERLQLSFEYTDSRQWQKEMLPSGCKGIELKHASRDIGKRLFPELSIAIDTQKDADGLLIAEWARRNDL